MSEEPKRLLPWTTSLEERFTPILCAFSRPGEEVTCDCPNHRSNKPDAILCDYCGHALALGVPGGDPGDSQFNDFIPGDFIPNQDLDDDLGDNSDPADDAAEYETAASSPAPGELEQVVESLLLETQSGGAEVEQRVQESTAPSEFPNATVKDRVMERVFRQQGVTGHGLPSITNGRSLLEATRKSASGIINLSLNEV